MEGTKLDPNKLQSLILDNFKIRTLETDLKNAPVAPLATAASAKVPLPPARAQGAPFSQIKAAPPPGLPVPPTGKPEPIKPAIPAKSAAVESLRKQALPPTPPKKISKRVLLWALILVIILGGFGVYWTWFRPMPEPAPAPIQVQPEPAPEALFAMQHKTIIALEPEQMSQLGQKIQAAIQTSQPAGDFTQLVIAKKTDAVSNPNLVNYPNLAEVLGALGLPASATQRFSGINAKNFTIFVYSQKQTSTSTLPAGRLGIVANLNNASSVKAYLISEENRMPAALRPYLPGDIVSGTGLFLDNSYKAVPIRYINFPQSYLSIDYAVWNNWLLMATSKETTYSALDKILSK